MTGRRARLDGRRAPVVGVAVAVVWVVRDGDGKPAPNGLPPAPQPAGLSSVSPDRLRQDEEFTVTTPTTGRRGRVLARRWDGVGWTYQYQLLGSAGPDGGQRWRTWSERTASRPDVTLGSEPVLLVIPSNAIAGDYRSVRARA